MIDFIQLSLTAWLQLFSHEALNRTDFHKQLDRVVMNIISMLRGWFEDGKTSDDEIAGFLRTVILAFYNQSDERDLGQMSE